MRLQLDDDDPILREHRRIGLARRLISHGVRTEMISHLIGLTRSRLATVRRRLLVSDEMRLRGPVRGALEVFRGSARGRAEGAALVAVGHALGLFKAPESRERSQSLQLVEQLCDTFDAYYAVFPESRAELEDFLLLYRAVALRRSLVQETCRRCHCLILVDSASLIRECSHCNPTT